MKPKRKCIDCGVIISDKRYKYHSQGIRCTKCQEAYREDYLKSYKQKWWKSFGWVYIKRRLGSLPSGLDGETVLNYLKRHIIFSRHMIRINLGTKDRPLYMFEHDVSRDRIKEFEEKYGEEYVEVLPLTKRC